MVLLFPDRAALFDPHLYMRVRERGHVARNSRPSDRPGGRRPQFSTIGSTRWTVLHLPVILQQSPQTLVKLTCGPAPSFRKFYEKVLNFSQNQPNSPGLEKNINKTLNFIKSTRLSDPLLEFFRKPL